MSAVPLNTGNRDRIEADSRREWAASVAYGTAARRWVRTEAELAWRWTRLHGYNHGQLLESVDGEAHALALMGNAWLQAPLQWRIVSYAGGGIGPALEIREGRTSLIDTDLDEISGVFAWQVGAGLRIGISARLSADLGVRHFETGNDRQRSSSLASRSRWRRSPGRGRVEGAGLAREPSQTEALAAVRVCCAAPRFS